MLIIGITCMANSSDKLKFQQHINRVAAGFSPAAPCMRVRTGRFPLVFKPFPEPSSALNKFLFSKKRILIEIAPRLVSLPPPKINTHPIGFTVNFEIVESCPCPTGFSPSPCPIRYDRHLATMASADFWSLTISVSRYSAVCLLVFSEAMPPSVNSTACWSGSPRIRIYTFITQPHPFPYPCWSQDFVMFG